MTLFLRIESYGKVPHFPPTLGNELNINLLAQFKALVKRCWFFQQGDRISWQFSISFFSTAMKSRKEIERANMEVHRDVGDHVQKIRETFASLFSLQRGKTVAR